MMLMCNETVTLVRHIKTKTSDAFTCIAIVGASWYGKTVIQAPAQMGVNGVQPANVIKVRIPEENMPEGLMIQKGDYLVRGMIAGVSNLDDLKGREYMKAMTVSDNRRGRMQHWAVTGA